jgi:hypothetical protein
MMGYNWTQVDGGYPNTSHPKFMTSAHMKTATVPDGANEGMLDGHVEWVPFNKFIWRTANTDDPIFYW